MQKVIIFLALALVSAFVNAQSAPPMGTGSGWDFETGKKEANVVVAIFTMRQYQADMGIFPSSEQVVKDQFLAELRQRNSEGHAQYFGKSKPFKATTGGNVTFIRYTQSSQTRKTANLFVVFPLSENSTLSVNLSYPMMGGNNVDWAQLEQVFHQNYNSLVEAFERYATAQ